MAINDADYESVTLDILFTDGVDCVPPGVIDALRRLNLRVNIPRTSSTDSGVFASTEANNLVRIDSEGGIYVPGFKTVVIEEVVTNLGTTTAPGEEVVVILPVPGISDPINAIKDIQVTLDPNSAAVNKGPLTVSGNSLRMGFTRVDYGQSAPFPPVTISVRGVVYEFAQPEPAA